MINRLFIILVSIVVLSGCVTMSLKVDPLVGTWNHKIENLPRGEPEGNFTINKEGEDYSGAITNSRGTNEITGIEISGNVLEVGHFEADGYQIKITGTFEGDSFTGNISTQGYEFPMTATRSQ